MSTRRCNFLLIAVAVILLSIGVAYANTWPLAQVRRDQQGEWLLFDNFETRLLQPWWDYGPAKDAWRGDKVLTQGLNRPVSNYEDEPLRWAKMSVEYRFDENIRRSRARSHNGRWSLEIQTRELKDAQGDFIGANVTVNPSDTLFWLNLRPESRFRFWLYGNPKATGATVKMHVTMKPVKDKGPEVRELTLSSTAADIGSWRQITSASLRSLGENIDPTKITDVTLSIREDQEIKGHINHSFFIDDFEISNAMPPPPRVVDAVNDSSTTRVRPILIGFRGRKRAYAPTLLFNDLSGWNVYVGGGWKAKLERSQEEPLFEDTPWVGKFTYSGAGKGWAEIRPAKPPVINTTVDMVRLWVYGQHWAWVADASTPFAGFLVELTDAQGKRHYIDLCRYMAKHWNLLLAKIRPERHRIVGGNGDTSLALPARLTALIVYGEAPAEPRSLYFDSVTVCKEDLTPAVIETDYSDLPIPTTSDTILPSTVLPVKNIVHHRGKTTEFIARSNEETIVYRYTPRLSGLSDLEAILPDGRKIKPADGGGPGAWLEGKRFGPDNPRVKVKLLEHRQMSDGVMTRWRWTRGKDIYEFTMTLAIKGKSMVIDWSSQRGTTAAFVIGTITGIEKPRLVTVPFMMWGHPLQKPSRVVLADGEYIFTNLDWYNTNSFAWSSYSDAGDNWAICNGDAFYFPDSAGHTAPLLERQFITISKRFEEVLPNIPNPPSPFKDVLTGGIYWHGSGAKYMEGNLQMLKGWKRLGVDSVFFSLHEAMWTEYDKVCQGPQAFTFTTDLSEEIDRDRFIEITKEIRQMGYHMGPYFNPSDYSPLGRHFDERDLIRTIDLGPMRAWPPCWGIKPAKAVDLANWFLPVISEEFNLNNAYMDTLTAFSPWRWVDSDARFPGASRFSTNYRAYCKFALLARQYINGPVFSEGPFQWIYAGLHEGSYGRNCLPYDGTSLVDFRLRKINPLMTGIGAGPVHESDAPAPLPAVAGTILWANMASANDGPAHLMYYLTVPFQKRYIMERVDKIRYGKDGKLFDTSTAIANGAVKENQVLVRYQNGLELAVNGSESKDWKITIGQKEYILPPGGWAARQGETFESYALKVNGHWVATTRCPEWEIVMPYGKEREFRNVISSASMVLRFDDPRGVKLIPFEKFGKIVLKFEPVRVQSYTMEGTLIGDVPFSRSDRGWVISSEDTRASSVKAQVGYYIISTRSDV